MIRFFRRIFIFACVIWALFAGVSRALSILPHDKKQETVKALDLFDDALTDIQMQYVSDTKPKDLVYGAIAGMLNALDPYSQFLSPEEYDELKIDTEGRFGGIGVEIVLKDNLLTIVTPMEGTPAWDAGIKTGDRIVKINDVLVRNFTLNDAVKKLRGRPGTDLRLVVWREKDGRLHSFRLKRAIIDIRDIKEPRIVEGSVGYLRLVEFREKTPQNLDSALKDLRGRGMKSLIIDLRNNPGGLLNRAIEATQRFLPYGTLIVSVKSRDPSQVEQFTTSDKTADTTTPMVLLVNGGSASGSEIMAGALKDHKRAILLGEKTFGKGSVQTVLPLKDGSALKLTTGYYVTPSGQTIHDKGIAPDIEVKQPEPAEIAESEAPKDVDQIFAKAEEGIPVTEAPAIREKAPERPEDIQLSRAVDLLKRIP